MSNDSKMPQEPENSQNVDPSSNPEEVRALGNVRKRSDPSFRSSLQHGTKISSPSLRDRQVSTSFLHKRVSQDDDRPLRSSQATLELQSSGVEVVYKDKTGRQSRVSKLSDDNFSRAVRSSVANSCSTGPSTKSSRRASQVRESDLDELRYNYSQVADCYQEMITDEDLCDLATGIESMTSLTDRTLSRVSTLRASSTIRNSDSQLLKQESRLSTINQVRDRNSDPSLRKRPTSAGTMRNKSLIRNDISNFADDAACVGSMSDTELSNMEINVTWD